MKYLITLLLSLGAYTASAATVHVCTDADGKKSFQDKPCKQGLKAETKVMETDPNLRSTYDPTAKTTAYQQMRAENNRLQLDRDIRRSENKILEHTRKMQSDLSALRNKKNRANNNLAGAEWENSISTEMQAVTSKYSTLITSEEARLANLRKQAAGN